MHIPILHVHIHTHTHIRSIMWCKHQTTSIAYSCMRSGWFGWIYVYWLCSHVSVHRSFAYFWLIFLFDSARIRREKKMNENEIFFTFLFGCHHFVWDPLRLYAFSSLLIVFLFTTFLRKKEYKHLVYIANDWELRALYRVSIDADVFSFFFFHVCFSCCCYCSYVLLYVAPCVLCNPFIVYEWNYRGLLLCCLLYFYWCRIRDIGFYSMTLTLHTTMYFYYLLWWI